MSAHGYDEYRKTSVTTANAPELLMMLLDAGVRHTRLAVEALESHDYQGANHHLLKGQDILSELMASLDYTIDLAQSLFQLYEFCHYQLVQANVGKDATPARAALEMLSELRDTWQTAIRGGGIPKGETNDTRLTSVPRRGGIEFAG